MQLFPSSGESVRYTVSSVTNGRFQSTNERNQSITCYTRLGSGFLNGRKNENFQYTKYAKGPKCKTGGKLKINTRDKMGVKSSLHENWDYPNGGPSKHCVPLIRGVHTCLQTIALCGYNFANGYDINARRMSSFYVTSFGKMKNVLGMRLRSASTRFTSGSGIVKSAAAPGYDLESSGSLSWAPISLLSDMISWKLLEDEPLAMRQKLWFKHDGAPAP
jgi:hypothetical protein